MPRLCVGEKDTQVADVVQVNDDCDIGHHGQANYGTQERLSPEPGDNRAVRTRRVARVPSSERPADSDGQHREHEE